jgi:hypothetical protein
MPAFTVITSLLEAFRDIDFFGGITSIIWTCHAGFFHGHMKEVWPCNCRCTGMLRFEDEVLPYHSISLFLCYRLCIIYMYYAWYRLAVAGL